MNKQLLCEAFCGELEVREVPAGLAVKTAFRASDGDAIGFYITRHPTDPTLARIEDSGLLVSMLEAHGADLDRGARSEALGHLLSEYEATYDDDAGELQSRYVQDPDLPAAAMRFIALLLRVRDLELLSPDNVASTFRQDAERTLRNFFSGKAHLQFHVPAAENLSDFVPDALITSPGVRKNLALYFATSEQRVDEAVMLWMESEWHQRNLDVAILLETEKPPKIGGRSLRRAMNRVHIATYRGDEDGSMRRIATYAGIESSQWMQ